MSLLLNASEPGNVFNYNQVNHNIPTDTMEEEVSVYSHTLKSG